ncbi:hypothetical protein ASG76_05535 [Nocardioides sp. Soil774]|nr:hypothetical protein ASG76_05535 [Nocardioides sp. Soil774]
MRIKMLVHAAVAVLCTTALVAAPSVTATANPRPVQHSRAAVPTITAHITRTGVRLTGVDGLHAGRAELVVTGKGDTTVSFGTLRRGYSWTSFSHDLVAGFVKNKATAIKRIYAKTDAIGGLAPGGTGTIVFPHPGKYFAFTFGEKGPSKPAEFVVGARRRSRAPHVDGRIVAADGPGWRGSSTMPAKGTFLFKNAATTKVLHFVELQRVKEGTTVQEVLATFQGPETQGPPPWFMPGSMQADVISQRRSMTVDYDLPPGQYVVLCFMPDPKMGGMPHALMGMIEMIHLT